MLVSIGKSHSSVFPSAMNFCCMLFSALNDFPHGPSKKASLACRVSSHTEFVQRNQRLFEDLSQDCTRFLEQQLLETKSVFPVGRFIFEKRKTFVRSLCMPNIVRHILARLSLAAQMSSNVECACLFLLEIEIKRHGKAKNERS